MKRNVRAVFDAIGSRLLKYYEAVTQFDNVGLIAANDDWGVQYADVSLADHMREYVFPRHKKIVDAAHSRGLRRSPACTGGKIVELRGIRLTL